MTEDKHAQTAFELAVSHHQAGRLAEAEKGYRGILKSAPSHAGALHLLGMIGHQTGNLDVAVDLITKALAIAPDYAEAHNNLGNALKDLGRLEEAVASYRRCIAVTPDYAMAHNNLGSALADRGETDDAIACYRKALDIAPDYAVAHYNLGNALRDTDRPEEAAACYRRAIGITPGLAEAHLNLGTVLSAQDKPDEAAACFDRALEIAPAYAEAHLSLGDLHRSQDRPDEAAACYRRAIETDPGYADAQLGLGRVLQDQGALDEAIACYRRTIDIAPDCANAHYALSTLLNTVGRMAEARQALEEGCRLRPITTIGCTGDKPLATVLKLVGLASTHLSLKDGKPTITGGNLDTVALIDKAKFTVHECFVHEDNLLSTATELPPFDIVLNGIVEPDLEAAALNTAQAFIARQGASYLNEPRKIFPTTRDKISQLLAGIDNLVVPKVVRDTLSKNDASGFMRAIEKHGLAFPLIVRPVGGHVGAGMVKAEGEKDFKNIVFPKETSEFYFTEFKDYRSDDGHYRKMRFFFVDGEVFPYHLAISKDWLVHYSTADMEAHQWKKLEEEEFLYNCEQYMNTKKCDRKILNTFSERIGLDVFGVDCGILRNGELLLFEANSAMQLDLPDLHGEKSHRHVASKRIVSAFESMVLAKIHERERCS